MNPLFWVLLKSSSILRIKYHKRFVFSCNPPMMIQNPPMMIPICRASKPSSGQLNHQMASLRDINAMIWHHARLCDITDIVDIHIDVNMDGVCEAEVQIQSWLDHRCGCPTDPCHKFAHVTMGRTWTKLSKGRYLAKNALHRITLCCICCKRLNYIALHSFVHARTWY